LRSWKKENPILKKNMILPGMKHVNLSRNTGISPSILVLIPKKTLIIGIRIIQKRAARIDQIMFCKKAENNHLRTYNSALPRAPASRQGLFAYCAIKRSLLRSQTVVARLPAAAGSTPILNRLMDSDWHGESLSRVHSTGLALDSDFP